MNGSVQSSKVILDFFQNRTNYDGLRQRKRQENEMKAILTSLDTKLGSLKKKMDKASTIKVNLCKGQSNVITSAKQKETLLSVVLGQLSEIKEEIIKSGSLSKLKNESPK